MTDDWKTLRVPKDAYEKAKAQKEEADRTWGEQIVRGEATSEPEAVIESVEIGSDQQGVTEDEVESIVENWLQNNWRDLQQGRI